MVVVRLCVCYRDYTVEITYETSSSFVPAVDDFPRSNVLASYTSPGREPGPYPVRSSPLSHPHTFPLHTQTHPVRPFHSFRFV
jgi:hypothetical protein